MFEMTKISVIKQKSTIFAVKVYFCVEYNVGKICDTVCLIKANKYLKKKYDNIRKIKC